MSRRRSSGSEITGNGIALRSANSTWSSSGLRREAGDPRPERGELGVVVAEPAGLRRAAARAGNLVPAREAAARRAGRSAGRRRGRPEMRRAPRGRPGPPTSRARAARSPSRGDDRPAVVLGDGKIARQLVGIDRRCAKGSLSAVIDLRSDTQTKPSAGMRAAMASAEVGDEQRREDPTVLALEERAAAFLGQEEAVYLPTATMANQIALSILGQRGTELVVEETAHIMISELGGAAMHSGLQTRGLPGYRGRSDRRADAARRSTRRTASTRRAPRSSRSRTPTTAPAAPSGRSTSCEAVVDVSRELGLAVHLDGARHRERLRRARRAGRRIGGSFRHRDAVPLEGARLPARRRDRGLARPDGAGPGREAPLRRRDAAGRDRRRSRALRARAQRRAARRRPRPRAASRRRAGLRAASRSIRTRSRRTSSRSTSARSGSPRPRRSSGCAAAGVGLSGTVRPGVLRAVTHLDIDDADIDAAIEVVPAGAGAPCPRLASSRPGSSGSFRRTRRRRGCRRSLRPSCATARPSGRARSASPTRGGHRGDAGDAVPGRLDHEDLHRRCGDAAPRRGQARPRRPARAAPAGDRPRLADAASDARSPLGAAARGRGDVRHRRGARRSSR